MNSKKKIPTYSLDQFTSFIHKNKPYQVEVFDANRHFEVQYPHRHDFYEVLFLTHGSGKHIIDNNQYNIQPPCIFFLSPGQAHKLELSQDIAGYIFLFTAEFYLLHKNNKNKLLELPFFFNIKQENPPLRLLSLEDQQLLIQLFKRGCQLMQDPNDQFEIINALLDLILNLCHQLYPKQLKSVEKGKGQILVKRFRQLIEEKYQENPTIQQYADWLHVTPNHLTQTVKSLVGKTSSELIQEKTILEIKRLLIYTDLTASEIANQLNYHDQSYFTKFFKRATGMTPTEFKKNH
ncbi:helix-turn-helix domain-containing protein [Xanthovirga aplysinae]|uniref:helix-turn-helix domain-containing protein n=1 Tax=Xanthovirga aplysinae TaxID=2529853 RepID=UPI0012BB5027|nr:AraC family transcriptional regulator [Xanthovirga aplysinae]MTI31740.1 helix-turn-helix domain-containing protein [Xanthovirga aplysinae]